VTFAEQDEEEDDPADWGSPTSPAGPSESEADEPTGSAKKEEDASMMPSGVKASAEAEGESLHGIPGRQWCRWCREELAVGLATCTRCGSQLRWNATAAAVEAAETLADALRLRVVWTDRGGRSKEAVLGQTYRSYVKRAKKFGFDSVADRYEQ
jgi:hypothetical protein